MLNQVLKSIKSTKAQIKYKCQHNAKPLLYAVLFIRGFKFKIMILKFEIKLPYYKGEIVKEYLKKMTEKVEYNGFTINDNLEVVECKCTIISDGSWNYHNNYDNSQLELAIIVGKNTTRGQWFSLSKEEAINIQKENIKEYKKILANELLRLNGLLA